MNEKQIKILLEELFYADGNDDSTRASMQNRINKVNSLCNNLENSIIITIGEEHCNKNHFLLNCRDIGVEKKIFMEKVELELLGLYIHCDPSKYIDTCESILFKQCTFPKKPWGEISNKISFYECSKREGNNFTIFDLKRISILRINNFKIFLI